MSQPCVQSLMQNEAEDQRLHTLQPSLQLWWPWDGFQPSLQLWWPSLQLWQPWDGFRLMRGKHKQITDGFQGGHKEKGLPLFPRYASTLDMTRGL